jgi:Fe-S-cluster containining protein
MNNAKSILENYDLHAASVDKEFQRVYDKFAHRMQCRRGCSMCCSQMFSISAIEGAYISRAIKALPQAERDRLKDAARQYIRSAKTLTKESENPEDTFTPRPGLRLPCPALKDDACSIYAARPLICRKWGVPMFNPRNPMELQACELNFKPGEEVDIEGVLEPQVELLEEWVELKGRAQQISPAASTRTTIAEAIVNDFEELLARNPVDEHPTELQR